MMSILTSWNQQDGWLWHVNGEARTFPLTTEIETILKGQLAEHDRLKAAGTVCPFVFHRHGKRIREFRPAWANACTAAGCSGKLIHDMRRSAVRTLERAGVPRSTAMQMVGHKTESIYKRYAIVDAAMLREAAARLDAWAQTPQASVSTGMVTAFTRRRTTAKTGTGSEGTKPNGSFS
jgi:hypothetical protein